MNVLMVAPDVPERIQADNAEWVSPPDLPNGRREVQSVIRSLGVRTALLGPVTRLDLMRAVQDDHFDLIWFACHSGRQGILLTDGWLTGDMLAQMVRGAPPQLIYLNSCESEWVALDIYDSVGCGIICTVAPVMDVDSFVTGATFAYYLAQGMGYRAAFEMSRPGHDQIYRMIGGADGDRIDKMLQEIQAVLSEIERVRTELGEVRANSKCNSDRLDELGHQLTPSKTQRRSWLIGYMLFVLIFFFTFFEIRQTLGFQISAALIAVVMLAALAYIPLTRALKLEIWSAGDN